MRVAIKFVVGVALLLLAQVAILFLFIGIEEIADKYGEALDDLYYGEAASSVFAVLPQPQEEEEPEEEEGGAELVASYYERCFGTCAVACPGEPEFDPELYTAASNTYPCGSLVELSRGRRSVIVRITDRGPFELEWHEDGSYTARPHPSRDIDLSRAVFSALAPLGAGVIKVRVHAATQ